MTAAELKTLRESLGLTTQWIADQASVQLRTAQYWEHGKRMAVPDDVSSMLINIDEQLDRTVEQSMEVVKSKFKELGDPEVVVLVRYRTDDDLLRYRPDMKPLPTTTHGVLLNRIRKSLALIGVESVIEYMEPAEYQAWLGKRKDSESLRSVWAASKCSESH